MATEKIVLSAVDQTKAAFQSVQGNIAKLTGTLRGVAGPLAAAFSVGAIASFSKSIIDAADKLKDLSESTGLSTQELGRFGNAAQLNGSSAEEFQNAIVKFSKTIGDAQQGLTSAQDAFTSLGISITDSNGKIKPTIQLFGEVSDSFANTADGAGKAKVAQDLFGRSGARLIPVLNQGAAALNQYQATFSDEFIQSAGQFNDEIDKLSINFQRIASVKLTPILQSINEFLNPESVSYAEGLNRQIADLQKRLETGVQRNFFEKFFGVNLGSAGDREKIAQLQELLRETNRMAAATAPKEQAKKQVTPTKTDMTPLEELVDRNKKIIELLDKGKTPIQKYQEALEELEMAKVGLTDEAYLENLMRINEEYENAQPKIERNKTALEQYAEASRNLGQQLDNFAVSALGNLEDALLGVMTGTMSVKDAFKSMATSIISDLMRIYIQRSITGPLADALFGSLPAPGASPTGKAIGGSVQAGQSYMVGERGPEMFIPNASGSIVPNEQVGGGGGTTIINQTLQISTGVAQTVRAEIQNMMPRITEATKAAVADAKRRGGNYGKMMA